MKIGKYYGELYNYRTGERIRAATAAEKAASERAASSDGGHGVITVNRVPCYVQHGGPDASGPKAATKKATAKKATAKKATPKKATPKKATRRSSNS